MKNKIEMQTNYTAIFPNIRYEYWYKNNKWEDRSSIQKILTNLKNRDLIHPDITTDNISDHIKNEIKEYISSKNENLLLKVFTCIQVWGGSSARVHTPKMIENFPIYKDTYKKAVEFILKNEITNAYRYLKNEDRIKGLGPSFIPKHIFFWTGKGDRNEGAPILDNVISKILYNTKVEKIDYDTFINEVAVYSQSIKMKPAQVEAALFSFAQNYWNTTKTRTNSFRNNIEDMTDQHIALQLINN